MPKGIPNKRYTPEFEKLVVETMPKEKLSYRKAADSSKSAVTSVLPLGKGSIWKKVQKVLQLSGVAAAARAIRQNSCQRA